MEEGEKGRVEEEEEGEAREVLLFGVTYTVQTNTQDGMCSSVSDAISRIDLHYVSSFAKLRYLLFQCLQIHRLPAREVCRRYVDDVVFHWLP